MQFLNLIELCHPKIPHIPILDTIVFKGGQPDYMLKFSRTLKLDRSSCREYQKVILERKRELISRDHELMVEMDSRWNSKKN